VWGENKISLLDEEQVAVHPYHDGEPRELFLDQRKREVNADAISKQTIKIAGMSG
jgi:hypothetical protein